MDDHQAEGPVNPIDSEERNGLSPIECIVYGWYYFKQNARIAVLGSGLYLGLQLIDRLPKIGWIYGLFIGPALLGG